MLPVYFPGRKKRELHTKITVITINCCNSEVHNIRVYTALNFMFPGEQRLYIHKIRHLCKYYNAVVQALKKKTLQYYVHESVGIFYVLEQRKPIKKKKKHVKKHRSVRIFITRVTYTCIGKYNDDERTLNIR